MPIQRGLRLGVCSLDLLYQSFIQPGSSAGSQTLVPSGLQIGMGTRAASNEIIFTQGSFQETDNPLDLVIQGNGYFQVRVPNGQTAFTPAMAVFSWTRMAMWWMPAAIL